MKSNKTWLAVLAAVAALTAAQTVSAASAQSRYKVTDLGTLPGLANSYVWQNTLNNRGHVAAYASNENDPTVLTGASSFLWKGPGDIQLLSGLPGSTLSSVWGLNDLDQAVGVSDADGYIQAVLWERGRVHELGPLLGDLASEAFLINNAGVVVGGSFGEVLASAVYWYQGKVFTLPPLGNNSVYSHAFGVNDLCQVVGQSGGDYDNGHAVLWRLFPKPSVTDLGTLGGDGSWATAINNCGEIVGQAQTASGDWHPTLWHGNRIIDLQNFGDDLFGIAYAISDCGQVVGFSGVDLSDVTKAHALLWEDGRMINLQTQILGNSGWVLRQALGINDRGQITGIGQHNGKNRAFLLTLVNPQP